MFTGQMGHLPNLAAIDSEYIPPDITAHESGTQQYTHSASDINALGRISSLDTGCRVGTAKCTRGANILHSFKTTGLRGPEGHSGEKSHRESKGREACGLQMQRKCNMNEGK